MSRRSGAQSLAASPTLVGAITTLIIIVAIFLAYNASSGLPFVPVYRVSVVLPNAERLLPNNEVRIGGTRVGIIESVTPVINQENGEAAAKVGLKLDKSVEPLPEDTTARVRYKSSFGLKYLELTRGDTGSVPEGGEIPISQASEQVEFDDVSNTFDAKTREAVRGSLEGFGSALAARGDSLNETVQNLNPLLSYLRPVSNTLADPGTQLGRFFRELGDAARIVAPVAEQQAQLITNAAISFAAISSDPEALRDTISGGVPALEQGTVALRSSRPFLADLAELAERLRPGVRALRAALPTFNSALTVGAPVLAETPPVTRELRRVFSRLDSVVEQPQTKTTLLRLRDTFDTTADAAGYVAPFQTVCNYFNYYFNNFANAFSERAGEGTTLRNLLVNAPGGAGLLPPPTSNPKFSTLSDLPMAPLTDYSAIQANGRRSTFELVPNRGRFDPHVQPITHAPAYAPALTPDGQPDCQIGQTGYSLGQHLTPGQPASNPADAATLIPGAQGLTFTGRAP
jgi:virulence factor Mce-like protein